MTQRQRDRPKILSPEYLVGLTDGEGCFYVNIRPPRSKNGLPQVEFHFYIKLRGDHLDLLKKVQKSFGCGAVYRQAEKRANHSECYRFEINSRKDINRVLVPFFLHYPLQGPKSNDFATFCKIFNLVLQGENSTEKGLVKIKRLKEKMNLGARRVWKIRLLGGNVK
ncbi:MAG: LAGLIDADG family homing endonuclease [Candidatus Berkelbacteria bacterium]|nr:LAGLIDADG family homing endonuclease [Candidatus Berkelbacteria bacterium]